MQLQNMGGTDCLGSHLFHGTQEDGGRATVLLQAMHELLKTRHPLRVHSLLGSSLYSPRLLRQMTGASTPRHLWHRDEDSEGSWEQY